MPNGKQGDHPLTDILIYKMRVFSEKADTLITKLDALGTRKELQSRFDWFSPPQIEQLERELESMCSQTLADRKARGWELEE